MTISYTRTRPTSTKHGSRIRQFIIHLISFALRSRVFSKSHLCPRLDRIHSLLYFYLSTEVPHINTSSKIRTFTVPPRPHPSHIDTHKSTYQSPSQLQPTRNTSPKAMQTTLAHLPPRSPINCAISIIITIPPINKSQHDLHKRRGKDTRRENTNHDKVTLSILLPTRRLVVTLPPRIQRIRRKDTAQITKTRDNSRRSSYADLAMSRLEDLRRPGHRNRDRGTESESND